MRILHINKFLYRRGGAEGYMFDVAERQRAQGHDVEFFGMSHPENLQMRFERHFPAQVEFEPPPVTIIGKVEGAGRLLWSTSAGRGVETVVGAFRPEVVHVHNIYHQLSPSILRRIRAAGIPAVMTLHDYKLACPTYRFLDHGSLCEACIPKRFWNAPIKRCNGGSIGASALNAVELGLHTALRAYGPIDRFACPSRFLESKMREAGVFPSRLRWLPNFVDVDAVAPQTSPGAGVVYAGRLSDEKGVDVLIEAVARRPSLRLTIAGEGPSRRALERLSQDLGVADRVTFLGRLPRESLHELLRASAVAAVPSRWYENMPLAVLEAFASGLPVVATNLGGLPELIETGEDGLSVPPNDPEALAVALESLAGNPQRSTAMGVRARRKVEREFAPELHLERLHSLYAEAARVAHGRG